MLATAGKMGLLAVLNGRTGAFSGPIALPSGLEIATGGVDGDGRTDLVFGFESGSSYMFACSFATGQVIRAFEAFPGLASGVWLAVGDVNGDGRPTLSWRSRRYRAGRSRATMARPRDSPPGSSAPPATPGK